MGTQTTMFEKETKNEKRFKEFIQKNPKAMELFEFYTLEVIKAGKSSIGANAIVERIRWESTLNRIEEFKINNNYAPLFSRAFMTNHPQYQGFFKTREQK